MERHEFSYSTEINASKEDLYNWHMMKGAFSRLVPPWISIDNVHADAPVANKSEVLLYIKWLGMRYRWALRHENVAAYHQFQDRQVAGPFREWLHTHICHAQSENRSILEDRIEYVLPGGSIGNWLLQPYTEKQLKRVFEYRHEVVKKDLEHHLRFGFPGKKKIVIAGGTGLIGSSLKSFLESGGNEVIVLHRSAHQGKKYYWNPDEAVLNPQDLESVDVVINLAGYNVAKGRWTQKVKDLIEQSRINSTQLLANTIAQLKNPPKLFLSASAIGYYGAQEGWITEDSPSGVSFLSGVCQKWEKAALKVTDERTRVIQLRIGIVLTPKGGALSRMLLPFKLGLGGRLGDGQQWMSWIALDDLLGFIHTLIEHPEAQGVFNATAPCPVTNEEFSDILAMVLNRPAWFTVPSWILHSVFGEMADELLLSGSRVIPERSKEVGYVFRYPTLENALRYLLGSKIHES